MGATIPRSLSHNSPTEGVGMSPFSWLLHLEGHGVVSSPSSG